MWRCCRLILPLCALAVSFMLGCSGGSGDTATPVTVTIGPAAANVRAGDVQQFSATVNGSTNTAVSWEVSGVAGGNSTVGTIDTTGKFTAPVTLPTPSTITVQAVSQANPASQGTSAVTLLNPIPVMATVNPTLIGADQFTMVVTGNKFASGAKILFGGAALNTTFVSSTELTATGTATAAQDGSVIVQVQNPDPGLINSANSKAVTVTSTKAIADPNIAARFLEQSTFGPAPVSTTQLEYTNFGPFLQDQFSEPMSTYPDPDPSVNTMTSTQQVLFTNALTGVDQLRQRVALALSEIWVTSGLVTIPPQGMAPYMRLLLQDAFSNYRTLMYDVTLSPAMGHYLDMVNNGKPPTGSTHANENYARELLQLFTVGLNQLNEDGTLQLDGSGNPIPTYSQTDVEAFSRVFTGWTYPTAPNATPMTVNPPYWLGAMLAFENNHDKNAKTLLPVGGTATVLPGGQSSTADLNAALDNIFAQPSLAPFVCKQLIQHLVTSNPSTAYVKRVAMVFDSGTFVASGATFGSGQRGDLQAVIAAILLDPEARRGDDPTTTNGTDGHLREPILYIASILRAFGAASDGLAPVTSATNMAEAPLESPSVFNFFPPDYAIPGTNLLGPEFALQTTATALVRANFVNSFVFGSLSPGITTVSFTPYANLAANPNASGQLMDSLNTLLLHGSMSSSTRASILAAVNSVPPGSALQRAQDAIYLILSSSQYQVQH
jgi:uncharacterized protein (DUF1800 family)